jgi:hypothetical protein
MSIPRSELLIRENDQSHRFKDSAAQRVGFETFGVAMMLLWFVKFRE